MLYQIKSVFVGLVCATNAPQIIRVLKFDSQATTVCRKLLQSGLELLK